MVDGERETREFTSVEDVLDVIDILIEEVEDVNSEGEEFDVAQSVIAQIPFFACINSIIDLEHQQDIKRYLYCTKFGVSPFQGDFGSQPSRWVEKSFIIRSAFAKKERALREKVKTNGSKQ